MHLLNTHSHITPTSHPPGLVAFINQILDVFVGGDSKLGKVLHVGAQQGVFPHPQVVLLLGVEQVPNTLTVDLHVAHL